MGMWVVMAREGGGRARVGWLRYYGACQERGHVEIVGNTASATVSGTCPAGEVWAWLVAKARERGVEAVPVEMVPRSGMGGREDG